jgi:hypothetical protein
LKEFIESPHLESLLEVGKLGLTNPTEELHSYGRNARSLQAGSQYGTSIKDYIVRKFTKCLASCGIKGKFRVELRENYVSCLGTVTSDRQHVTEASLNCSENT